MDCVRRTKRNVKMKCKGCNADITKNLVMVEETYGDRATKIIGIETDPENFSSERNMDRDASDIKDGEFEIILGDTDEGDVWFDDESYQCSACHTEYTWEEIKEIFS